MDKTQISEVPVLIIDDEKHNLHALQRLLRKEFTVTITQSPLEALQLIQKQEFFVILSDQRMPEMSGVEFFEKSRGLQPSAIRILITGFTDLHSVIDSINRGNVYRYIPKPWEPEELKITVRQAAEAYDLRRQLQKTNQSLFEMNTELKKALGEVAKLDEAKKRFLSLVTHELNTPLTVLTGFVDLISEQKQKLPVEIQRSIDSLKKASDGFSDLIGEVLQFVELEALQELKLVATDLSSFLEEILQEFFDDIKKKKIQLEIKKVPECVAKLNRTWGKTAIQKIVKDLLYRVRENTEVQISLYLEEPFCSFVVESLGEAYSKEALEALEIGTSILRHGKNLGLGLAMARVIAQLHHGELEILSTSQEKNRLRISFLAEGKGGEKIER